MKEQLMQIIKRHNATVEILGKCDIPVSEGKVLRAMEIWHRLACEGADITDMARKYGIDAKCDMQSGEITVLGDIPVPDAYPELAEYDDEDYRIDLYRDNPDLDGPDYEVVFEVAGERYYCFIHGTESLLEALGLFFQHHPHITHDMIFEHDEYWDDKAVLTPIDPAFKVDEMPLAEIINSLEDQAQDKDSFVSHLLDEPDNIFTHDIAALRAAVKLLRRLEV